MKGDTNIHEYSTEILETPLLETNNWPKTKEEIDKELKRQQRILTEYLKWHGLITHGE